MGYLYSAIILFWTGLFGVFFLLRTTEPEPPPKPETSVSFVPPTQNLSLGLSSKKEEPTVEMSKKEYDLPAKEEYVPISKDQPPITLLTDNKKEIPSVPTPKSIEDNIRTLIENRLVSILVRVNIAACKTCTPDDKRIILQLKMAKALTEGNVELAQYYSKEMNKYVKQGRVKMGSRP